MLIGLTKTDKQPGKRNVVKYFLYNAETSEKLAPIFRKAPLKKEATVLKQMRA